MQGFTGPKGGRGYPGNEGLPGETFEGWREKTTQVQEQLSHHTLCIGIVHYSSIMKLEKFSNFYLEIILHFGYLNIFVMKYFCMF